jgi:hypothetical protein
MNAHIIPDADVPVHIDPVPDDATFPDNGLIHDLHESPYDRPLANNGAFRYDRRRVRFH